MKEIPVCNRCCFCLPLRIGLLVWGYFKVIADALIIPILAYFVLMTIITSAYGVGNNKRYMIWFLLYTAIALITLIMFITDFVATIVFIVGGHKKNAKLIKGFYIYSIGMLVVTTLLIVSSVCLSMVNNTVHSWEIRLIIFVACFLTLVVQTYFLFLLRSEVMKLKNSSEFRFVNNSNEAEYMMNTKEKEAGRETESETV